MAKGDPHTWAPPPPLPSDPDKYRVAMFPYEKDRLTRLQVETAANNIAYYPELQDATLKLLSKNPHPGLIAAMAEAVLKEFVAPGESPSDVDRLRAIAAVRAAFKADVDHGKPPAVHAPV